MVARRIRGVRLTREERLEVRRLIENGRTFEQARVGTSAPEAQLVIPPLTGESREDPACISYAPASISPSHRESSANGSTVPRIRSCTSSPPYTTAS